MTIDSTSSPISSSQSGSHDSRLAWLLFTATALMLSYLSLRPIDSPDFWWHVSMGKATLEAGASFFPDPLAVSASGDYVNIVWLFDVPLFLLYRAGGLVAVNLCLALFTSLSFLLLYLLALEVASGRAEQSAGNSCHQPSPWMPLIVATLAAGATHLRFIPRPQAAFLTLLPLVLWLAWRTGRLRGRTQWAHILGLWLVVFLWARVHASVVIAPAVIAAALIRLPVSLGKPALAWERLPGLLRIGRLWIALAVATLLPFTGPSGFDLIRRVLDHGENYAVRHIAEMKPMTLDMWFAPTRDIFFAEVLAVLAVIGVWRRRSIDVSCLCLAGLGLYLTLGTNRFSSAWAVLLVPVVTQGLLGLSRSRSGSRLLSLGTALLVVATLSLSTAAPSFEAGPQFRPETAQAIRALAPEGVVFNDYDLGGYLGLELYGQPRVVIDSRSQMHFSVEEQYSALHALRQPKVFSVLDRLHHFSSALVPKGTPLCQSLEQGSDWAPLWFSESRVLFLPSDANSSMDVSGLGPCTPRAALSRCRSLGPELAVSMVESMRTVTPLSPYLARQAVLMNLQCSDPPKLEAAAAALQVAALDADHADFRWIEGFFLLAGGDLAAAEVALSLASPDHLAAQTLRLQLLRGNGRSREARELASRLVIASEDQDMPRLREILAWACEQEGDLECAVRESIRAAQSGDSSARERLERLMKKGSVAAELQPLARALLPGPKDPAPFILPDL